MCKKVQRLGPENNETLYVVTMYCKYQVYLIKNSHTLQKENVINNKSSLKLYGSQKKNVNLEYNISYLKGL